MVVIEQQLRLRQFELLIYLTEDYGYLSRKNQRFHCKLQHSCVFRFVSVPLYDGLQPRGRLCDDYLLLQTGYRLVQQEGLDSYIFGQVRAGLLSGYLHCPTAVNKSGLGGRE